MSGTTEPRCEKTDLLVSMCDHCRPKLSVGVQQSRRRVGNATMPAIEAQYDGWCPECDEAIEAGVDMIVRSDDDGYWIHEECR